ncbi:uncharacterized protein Dvir_GJ26641 [Drosophila virilis]|uniref:Uncharacterized protein n=1 Tax=Drosophila virilis TaxID=7244 RepID=A0A0Q9WHZ0_DROVI|nr:uncharacterized protein Dvir_GJ26641 [Drosophila virilis]
MRRFFTRVPKIMCAYLRTVDWLCVNVPNICSRRNKLHTTCAALPATEKCGAQGRLEPRVAVFQLAPAVSPVAQ